MALVVFDHPDSPNCRKVRLAVSAFELDVERRRVDLLSGGTRTAEFLAINPRGQLPVLVDGDFTLPESNAILGYLAARSRPEWLGRTLQERADVQRWLFWQSAGITRRIAAVGYQRQIRPLRGEAPDETAILNDLASFTAEVPVFEQHLEHRTWLVGRPTVAELALGPWFEVARSVGLLTNLPASRAWLERLEALPFWSQAAGYELLAQSPAQTTNTNTEIRS